MTSYVGLRYTCPEPGCGRTLSGWPPAIAAHAAGHTGARVRGPSVTRCVACDAEMHTAAQPGPTSTILCSDGTCRRCVHRARRHRLQPPGAPRATRYPQRLLLSELRELRLAGVTDVAEQARRLGMKPLSLQRALDRARAAGQLAKTGEKVGLDPAVIKSRYHHSARSYGGRQRALRRAE